MLGKVLLFSASSLKTMDILKISSEHSPEITATVASFFIALQKQQ